MRALLSLAFIFCILPSHAVSLDLGVGYSFLDLKNPDSTTARSTGFGTSLGGYWSLFGNENYDFGVKGSAFYSQMKNDMNTSFLSEETEMYNMGLGLELEVHNVFASWQYKYNRIDIQLSGNLTNTSAFSDYMSQFELGYTFHMDALALRLVYQRIDGKLAPTDTGLSAETDLSSSAFMIVLRFDLSSQNKNNFYDSKYGSSGNNEYKADTTSSSQNTGDSVPNYRFYRYSPRPSMNIK